MFVKSSREDAVRRIIQKDNLTADAAARRIEQVNRGRSNHYQQYTGHRWTDGRDYDLIVNTSVMGLEQIADLIVECWCKPRAIKPI